MDYQKIYLNLILSRQLLKDRKKNKDIYYEKHHIFPRSLGGTNDKNNLVLLTPKEHFIAHLLLTKIYEGEEKKKMIYAFWQMCNRRTFNKYSAKQYENTRILFKKLSKELGSKNKGRKHTEQSKKNMSEGGKGKKFSEEHKRKLKKRSEKLKGIPRKEEVKQKIRGFKHTEEAKEKIKNANLGKTKSYEVRKKISDSQIGRIFSKESIQKRTETRRKNGWNKNGRKSHSEEAKGKISKALKGRKPSQATIEGGIKFRQKPILQFDLNGNFIKEWPSIKIAATELKLHGVGACCIGNQKTTGNFTFKFKNPNSFTTHKKIKKTKEQILKNCKPVLQYDLQGNFIQEWESAKYAGINLFKKGGSDITAVCKGRQRTVKGFIFKYKNLSDRL